MGEINRSGVVLFPKAPFLEWIASASGLPVRGDVEGEDSQEPCIYLVRENEESLEGVIKREWACLFECELASWDTRESSWPKNRNLRMFRKWFDCQVHLLVLDLADGPIDDLDE